MVEILKTEVEASVIQLGGAPLQCGCEAGGHTRACGGACRAWPEHAGPCLGVSASPVSHSAVTLKGSPFTSAGHQIDVSPRKSKHEEPS